MIKKFSLIIIFSLVAQLLSVFSISYIIRKGATDSFIEVIALLDSSFTIITSILAFGILQIATREIVINKEWKIIVVETQNSRMTFAIIISIIGIVLFFFTKDNIFLTLLTSPLIAHNVNYVLYAKGKSLYATAASITRIILLSIVLIICGYFLNFSIVQYFIFFIFSLFIFSSLSNYFLGLNLSYKFTSDFYKPYLKSFKIGITDLAIVFLETGILFFAAFFYRENFISLTFLILKIYVLIKGLQRLVFQAFYNELANPVKVELFNKIIFTIGFVFFIISFNYSNEFLQFLFSKNDENLVLNFKILGITLLIGSVLFASIARTLVLKKDREYTISFILSLIVSFMVMVLFSFSNYESIGISLSLLIGEIILFISFYYFIWKDFKIKNYFTFYSFHIFLFVVYYFLNQFLILPFSIIISIFIEIIWLSFFAYQNKNQFFY